MVDDTLGIKFRQSKDYTHEMLVRDLMDMCQTLEKRLQKKEREGLWTPTIQFGSGSVGLTYSFQRAQWARIGRLVHIDMDVQVATKGTSVGALGLAGFPFVPAADTYGSLPIGYYTNLTLPASAATIAFIGNNNLWTLRLGGGSSVVTATEAAAGNSFRLIGSTTYLTDDP